MCVTSSPNCKFKDYDMQKLNWLKDYLSEAASCFHEEKDILTRKEVAGGTELLGMINSIQEVSDETEVSSSANVLWKQLQKVISLCNVALFFINRLQVPPLCDYIFQATDAGPGVGG